MSISGIEQRFASFDFIVRDGDGNPVNLLTGDAISEDEARKQIVSGYPYGDGGEPGKSSEVDPKK